MTQPITGSRLLVGDRIVAFTTDSDAVVIAVETLDYGGIMLTLDVYDRDSVTTAGSTYFITAPDAEYSVRRV
ncbi:hypothetical protein [Gordonia sp. (in: high G+C Gram-positive bacteria)]|uniref:hypothetical protein n=1 Tax=Gordonia sp. (in: high G+C Gram-positive bacteria) TaxID=84139 RepID=UPI003C77563B